MARNLVDGAIAVFDSAGRRKVARECCQEKFVRLPLDVPGEIWTRSRVLLEIRKGPEPKTGTDREQL